MLNMLVMGTTSKAAWDPQVPLMCPVPLATCDGSEMQAGLPLKTCHDDNLCDNEDCLSDTEGDEELDWWNPGGFSDQEDGYAPDCPCD
ncbi:unnamed protein product [Symbiodinium microadriaticum]|nr:unnamed protein product [Symbiodinium microadriaticum]